MSKKSSTAVSTPSTVEEWIKLHANEIEETEFGKIRFKVTNTDVPKKLDLLESYLHGRVYRRALKKKEEEEHPVDLTPYAPHIEQHSKFPNKVYCKRTKMVLNKNKEEIEKHMAGRKFKFHMKRFKKKKEVNSVDELKTGDDDIWARGDAFLAEEGDEDDEDGGEYEEVEGEEDDEEEDDQPAVNIQKKRKRDDDEEEDEEEDEDDEEEDEEEVEEEVEDDEEEAAEGGEEEDEEVAEASDDVEEAEEVPAPKQAGVRLNRADFKKQRKLAKQAKVQTVPSSKPKASEKAQQKPQPKTQQKKQTPQYM